FGSIYIWKCAIVMLHLTRDKLIAAQHALYARELTRICTNDRLIQIFVDKSASLYVYANENYIDSMGLLRCANCRTAAYKNPAGLNHPQDSFLPD
ncbi:MAG TPA: hypothetical protein DG355_05195, partial [Candidatus Cloacimonas sp.]|nr:hypothetical protein [Candidatus Cloacimonas sp.]